MAKNNEVTGWVGWIFFAGFMMILLGFFQAIAGLTAIFNSDWLVVTSEELMVLDLTAWGWAHLIMGLIVLVAGFSVMQGATWARAVGIVVAMFSAVANLAAINIYPLWAVIIITIDVFVIYALTVHGDELKDLE
jgi:hypothetical protein